MNILFASSEVAPFSKTGGLADICSSLPTALAKLGQVPVIVTPAYRCVFQCGLPIEQTDTAFSVPVGNKMVDATLWKSALPGTDIPVWFIRQDQYFDRDGIYTEHGEDYGDNCERFVFFCRAVMETIKALDWDIDLLHSNDWQTGLLPAYLKTIYADDEAFERTASLHTIHNLAYQGIFWHWDMLLTGIGWEHFTFEKMEFYGKLNLMKTGVMFADGVSTVSPQYAKDIQSPLLGCGMEGVLQFRSPMLRGILNGVCMQNWNPATDPHIAAPFTVDNVFDKKPLCKADLQRTFGLPELPDTPLFGVVSRLAHQKGIDLIIEIIPTWVEQHGVQFCILGTGNRGLEAALEELAHRYPDNVAVHIDFSDALAHKIESGSDMFLMPSRYEPCGLNQMYSQMYGTVPIVRSTGGLADTVCDLDDETLENVTATGFSFPEDDIHNLNATVWRALNVYWEKKDVWRQLVQSGMRQNWAWEKSAEQYVRFYEKLRTTVAARRKSGNPELDTAILLKDDLKPTT